MLSTTPSISPCPIVPPFFPNHLSPFGHHQSDTPQNTTYQRLTAISRTLSDRFSPPEVLADLLEILATQISYEGCVFRIQSQYAALACRLEQVINRICGRRIDIEIVPEDPDDTSEPDSTSIESKIAILMRFRNHLAGIVTLSRPKDTPFTADEDELAQLCVFFIALALQDTAIDQPRPKKALGDTLQSRAVTPHIKKVTSAAERLAQEAQHLSQADRIGVFSLKDHGGLDCQASNNLSQTYLAHLEAGDPSLAEFQAIQYLEPLLVANISKLPENAPARLLSEAEGFYGLAIYPFAFGEQGVASVACYYNLPHVVPLGEQAAMRHLVAQAAILYDNSYLYAELEDTYLQTILTLSKALDAHDTYTAHHSQRLADWAEQTARGLKLSEEEVCQLRWAALLHDVGKIGVPEAILCKAGPLTEEEWKIMRRHPVVGVEIVSPVKRLQPVLPIIRSHQEKYDGSGYPDGLQGEQIPLPARILTVVDAYGAMTDNRVFRKALNQEEAINELRRCSGTHFDTRIVNTFFKVLEDQTAY